MGHYHALERGILAAGWDITPKERAWLIERVSQLVDAQADGASESRDRVQNPWRCKEPSSSSGQIFGACTGA